MMLQSASLSYFFREQYPVFPDDKEFMLKSEGCIKKTNYKTISMNRSLGLFSGDCYSERGTGDILGECFLVTSSLSDSFHLGKLRNGQKVYIPMSSLLKEV